MAGFIYAASAEAEEGMKITDKMRLNWISENVGRGSWVSVLDEIYKSGYDFPRTSLRQAIDAAIRAQKRSLSGNNGGR